MVESLVNLLRLAIGAQATGAFSATLEGEPLPKARARILRTGGAYTPKRTRIAQEAAAWQLSEAKTRRFSGPVLLACVFYRGSQRRVDLDNLVKLVCDAGTEAELWEDDSQVQGQIALLRHDRAHPRTEVALCEYDPIETVAPLGVNSESA